MTTQNDAYCVIWPKSRATKRTGSTSFRTWHDSARAGGQYEITREAELNLGHLQRNTANQRVAARLTTWLVDARRMGAELPLVTREEVARAETGRDLRVDERADRLLRHLASQTPEIGEPVPMISIETTDWMDYGMAWSESTKEPEVNYLLQYLLDRGFTLNREMNRNIDGTSWTFDGTLVTVDGFARIADAIEEVDSSQAFVAMWFDPSLNDLYERGIKPGVEAAGYRALRIDQKPDADKIDDEIIAEIRRSRFVVADFTHGKRGARGGVYYEAGFAHGLNKPVIFTCREDMIEELHLDTRQYYHITWKEPEDLVEPLKRRIQARIVEGSNRQ